MTALFIIIGMFSALSLSFSVYSLIAVSRYERLRQIAKSNESDLIDLRDRMSRLNNSVNAKYSRASSKDGLIEQLLMRSLGLDNEREDDVTDDELLDEDL